MDGATATVEAIVTNRGEWMELMDDQEEESEAQEERDPATTFRDFLVAASVGLAVPDIEALVAAREQKLAPLLAVLRQGSDATDFESTRDGLVNAVMVVVRVSAKSRDTSEDTSEVNGASTAVVRTTIDLDADDNAESIL